MVTGGDVGLYINSGCRQVIDDLRKLLWPSDLSEGHAAAWLRYFIIREYPVRSEIKIERNNGYFSYVEMSTDPMLAKIISGWYGLPVIKVPTVVFAGTVS